MKELTTHRQPAVPSLNDLIRIESYGEGKYDILLRVNGEWAKHARIAFGSMIDNVGPSGITPEVLLAVLIDSVSDVLVKRKLHEALFWLRNPELRED